MEKIEFDILLPQDHRIANLMQNANWAHLISPERYDAHDSDNKTHLSALQFRDSQQQFTAVDRSIDVVLQAVRGLDRNRLKALEWSLNEITDNVLNHAESPIGGIVQVVVYPTRKAIDLLVCDAGVGIPRTLRHGRPSLTDDVSAVRAAIEEGVTRNSITNQGNGLFGTFKCCEVSEGEFEALTGTVSLRYKNSALKVSRNQIPFHGTFIRASIRYDYEKLLERALVFKGKVHDAGFDYIERVYHATGDDIDFIVKSELNSFGTRESGRLARNKIENLMNGRRSAVTFDFSDIRLISSSFADEVFGRLFVTLGPIDFGRLCKFKNVDSTVQALIDRAITQRMQHG